MQLLIEKFNNIEKELREIKHILAQDIIINENNDEFNNDEFNNDEFNNSNFKLMDNFWKDWVKINLQNGISKNDIFNILLNYNFNYKHIQTFLNWEPKLQFINERKDLQNNILPNNEFQIIKHNKTLQDNPKVYKIENNYLDIYKIYNFLSEEECHDLIQSLQNETFEKSTITNSNEKNKIRTSSTCHLFSEKNKLYQDLNNKICKTIGVNETQSEISQVQKYNIGEEFKQHTDYFDENLECNKYYLGERGQRTWTFMIYLNDVEEGGETYFPKINMKIKPICGTAIIWNNLINDEKVNCYSLHQGLPVLKGEKIIITKWFRKT
jgi:prolyl 4-hydroxylase